MTKKTIALLLFIIFLFGKTNISLCGEYPQLIETIDKTQADYSTPENTMSALRSALLKEDISWVDETMVPADAKEQIKEFQEAGLDRTQLFTMERLIKVSYIIDKINYKDGILLIIKDYNYNGSIKEYPTTLIRVDGSWKITNKYSSDTDLDQYIYYVPPLFNGKGQKPDDVNLFLGYAQPTDSQTNLAAGTASYTVHLYYGKTTDPTTFTAEMNKQDISSKFTPQPFTDQEVQIPLQQGRNTLTLSIDGTRKDGKKATDKDKLVFVVP